MAAEKEKPFSVENFSTPQLALLKEAYTIFAQQINKKGDYITVKELPNVLRSCGILVSFSDLEEITKEFGNTKQFDFADFLALAARSMKPNVNEETLTAAFRRFDYANKGTLPISDFKHVMSTLGDILTSVHHPKCSSHV